MEGVTAIKETEKPSLLERIYSWENLLNAYHEAANEKWYRSDVLAFSARLEENLIEIQNSLIWHTYKVGRYREFYVSEPKRRLIMALSFPDRVVQWAVYLQVNKELDNGMIYHSYGCRVGKGTTRAADRLQYWATLVDRKPGPSYFGMLSHCSTHGLQKWIEKNIVFKRKEPAAEAKEVNLWT